MNRSFTLWQDSHYVLCMHVSEIDESIMELVFGVIKYKNCIYICNDTQGVSELFEVNRYILPQSYHNKFELELIMNSPWPFADEMYTSLRLIGSDLPLNEFLSNYYKAKQLERRFCLFFLDKVQAKELSAQFEVKYPYELYEEFNSVADSIVRETAAKLPTPYGDFIISTYRNVFSGENHIVLVKGTIVETDCIPVRIHSECITGDCLHSNRCDCGEQLEAAFKAIHTSDCGVIIYMHQEGRGIGLHNKLRAYELQDNGADTVDANILLGYPKDMRTYSFAIEVLKSLKVKKPLLLTNNPLKMEPFKDPWFDDIVRTSLQVPSNEHNRKYILTKKMRMNQILDDQYI